MPLHDSGPSCEWVHHKCTAPTNPCEALALLCKFKIAEGLCSSRRRTGRRFLPPLRWSEERWADGDGA